MSSAELQIQVEKLTAALKSVQKKASKALGSRTCYMLYGVVFLAIVVLALLITVTVLAWNLASTDTTKRNNIRYIGLAASIIQFFVCVALIREVCEARRTRRAIKNIVCGVTNDASCDQTDDEGEDSGDGY